MVQGEDEDHASSGPSPFLSPSSSPSSEFSDVMAQLLMEIEELRRSTERQRDNKNNSTTPPWEAIEDIHQYYADLESLLPSLDQLSRWTADRADPRSVEADLFRHCQVKVISAAHSTLQVMMQYPEPSEMDLSEHSGTHHGCEIAVEDLLQGYQGAVAQTVELNLRLLLNNPPDTTTPSANAAGGETLPTVDDIVKSYVSFQRQTLRARVKPTIAHLVHERKRGFSTQPVGIAGTSNNAVEVKVYADDDEEDDAPQSPMGRPTIQYEKHHANALAVILGQAVALINPLLAWKVNLPSLEGAEEEEEKARSHQHPDRIAFILSRMCTNSIQVLDEQAQQLTKTVSDWFWDDRPADHFMEQSAAATAAAEDHASSASSLLFSGQNSTTNATTTTDLASLDGLVEEMALTCLLLAQYESRVHSIATEPVTNPNTTTTTISKELLPEWSWKYAALERYLAVQQWQTALDVAQPVQIVMDTQIFVPSVVEDAQYLSTRALERAASTQALAAMGTVAHAIAHDVWSTDTIVGGIGVHQTLSEERGCWIEPEPSEEETEASNKKKNKKAQQSSFASALLDAFDEDLGRDSPGGPKSSSSNNSTHGSSIIPLRGKNSSGKPASGNFLAALTLSGAGEENMRLLQMHAKFCALNGIHAASGACRSLVEYLDGLIPPPPAAVSAEGGDYPSHNDNVDNDVASSPPSLSAEDAKATAMIQLAREELFRFANTYEGTLKQKVSKMVSEYGRLLSANDDDDEDAGRLFMGGNGLCLDHVGTFIAHESYNIDANALQKLEREDRLEMELMGPLQSYIFLQQISPRCEFHVLLCLAEELVLSFVQVILRVLWRTQKPFTDWGSLLFSKQVRLIQTYVQDCVTPNDSDAGRFAASSGLVGKWERLTQVWAILQMEQPSEWLMYHDTSNTNNNSSVLTPEEVAQTMSLRVDFSPDAIAAVVNQTAKNTK